MALLETAFKTAITKTIGIYIQAKSVTLKENYIKSEQLGLIKEYLDNFNDTCIDNYDFQTIIESEYFTKKLYSTIFEAHKAKNTYSENIQNIHTYVMNEYTKLKNFRGLSIPPECNDIVQKYIDYLINILEINRDNLISINDKIGISFVTYEIREQINVLKNELDVSKDCMLLDEYNLWLKQATEPCIDLQFFNYNDKEFEELFFKELLFSDKNCIYLKSICKDEVLNYALYLLYDKKFKNVIIVDDESIWKKLNGKVDGKILIANFNTTNEISIIRNNVNIFLFDESDREGDIKNAISIDERFSSDTINAFVKCGVDIERARNMVKQADNRFYILRRSLFKGKNLIPSWKSCDKNILIKLLLVNEFTDFDDDKILIESFFDIPFTEVIQFISDFPIEDPFVNKIYGRNIFYLVNENEAWAYLLDELNESVLKVYYEYVKNVLEFSMINLSEPIVEFFENKNKPSNKIVNGVFNTLKRLSLLYESKSLYNIQYNINKLVQDYILIYNEEYDENVLYSHLYELTEAAPNTILSYIELDIKNVDSKILQSFKNRKINKNIFLGDKNKVTKIIYILEKLMKSNVYGIRAFNALRVILIEVYNCDYRNELLELFVKVFHPVYQEVDFSLNDKKLLFEDTIYMLKSCNILFVEFVKKILNDGNLSYVIDEDSRFKIKNRELITYDIAYEIRDYYFVNILKNADNIEIISLFLNRDYLNNTKIQDIIYKQFLKHIKNASEEEKIENHNQIAMLVAKYNFYNWNVSEKVINLLLELMYNIEFEIGSHKYIYLFKGYEEYPIDCVKFQTTKYHELNSAKLRVQRINAIEFIIDKGYDIIEFISKCDKNHHVTIGNILFEVNKIDISQVDFIEKLKTEYINVLLVYLNLKFKSISVVEAEALLIDYRINYRIVDEYAEYLMQFNMKILINLTLNLEEEKYIWNNYNPYYLNRCVREDDLDKYLIFEKLYIYGDVYKCITFISLQDTFKFEDIIRALLLFKVKYRKQLVSSTNEQTMINYEITKCFDKIYSQTITNEYIFKLIEIEVFFIEVINYKTIYFAKYVSNNYEVVHELLSLNPEIFIPFSTEDKELNLYTLLYMEFKNDYTKTEQWIRGLLNTGDVTLGRSCRKVLANLIIVSVSRLETANVDLNLCSIFEKYLNEEVKNILINKIYNSRGVFTPSKGTEESALSNKYMDYFEILKLKCPNLAKVYYDVSIGYRRDSLSESTLAKRSRNW